MSETEPIQEDDLLTAMTNEPLTKEQKVTVPKKYKMLRVDRRWMVRLLTGLCLTIILIGFAYLTFGGGTKLLFVAILFFHFTNCLKRLNIFVDLKMSKAEVDPNQSAGTPGQLLLTVPNKADVPKVRSWITDVKKGKVLHEYPFEPVILLVWLEPTVAGKLNLF